ncbi:V-set and transmembrane domain-containing protein 5 [Ambystoma mexicanum]|uniref:V-set and transmembrane domain-containing protein 5 n=1 Tax=Ambystoma mexicanum TaxID=8296 RepID=UPI0037E75324
MFRGRRAFLCRRLGIRARQSQVQQPRPPHEVPSQPQDMLTAGVFLALCFTQLVLQLQGFALPSPQKVINATVAQKVLLSIEYSCKGNPAITWEYMSHRGIQKIILWRYGIYINISKDYENRIYQHKNGSIELLNVVLSDDGLYTVFVTDDAGVSRWATTLLQIREIQYEDFFFVAVSIVFLVAALALMICFIRVCDMCVYLVRSREKKKSPVGKEEYLPGDDAE